MQVEHRRFDFGLDEAEDGQQDRPADQAGQDQRICPAHGVPAVRLDAVCDAGQQHDQPDGERDVAQPVDLGWRADADFLQAQIGPDRPAQPDRHGHDEDQAPVDGRQHAAEDQADELTGDAGHLVDPHRGAALVGGERVREDGRRVGHQHGAADRLDDSETDQPQRALRSREGVEGQGESAEPEDREAGVVHPNAAVDVAETAESDDEHCRDDEVAHEHPQQVTDVAGLQRVQVDAAEDGREGDDDDGGVDGGGEHSDRRIRQRDPLVAVAVHVTTAHAQNACALAHSSAPARRNSCVYQNTRTAPSSDGWRRPARATTHRATTHRAITTPRDHALQPSPVRRRPRTAPSPTWR